MSVGSGQWAVSGLTTKFSIFLFVCFDKHSERGLERPASVDGAKGQHSQRSFTLEPFDIISFSFQLHPGDDIPHSPECINRDLQYPLIGIFYSICGMFTVLVQYLNSLIVTLY